ncbi:hypothetical protein BHE74_00032136 [Ensete ventricosum]|nr:hypothetical protein BHE74_00032136 [Ensete ventricosum]
MTASRQRDQQLWELLGKMMGDWMAAAKVEEQQGVRHTGRHLEKLSKGKVPSLAILTPPTSTRAAIGGLGLLEEALLGEAEAREEKGKEREEERTRGGREQEGEGGLRWEKRGEVAMGMERGSARAQVILRISMLSSNSVAGGRGDLRLAPSAAKGFDRFGRRQDFCRGELLKGKKLEKKRAIEDSVMDVCTYPHQQAFLRRVHCPAAADELKQQDSESKHIGLLIDHAVHAVFGSKVSARSKRRTTH